VDYSRVETDFEKADEPRRDKYASVETDMDHVPGYGPERIGLGRAAVQGLAQGVADAAGTFAGSPVGLAGVPYRVGAAIASGDARALSSTAKARQIFESLMEPYLQKPGTENERTMQTVMRSAVMGVPAGVVGGGLLGATGAITGPLAGEAARRMGASQLGQIAANVAGGAAPGIVASGVARLPGGSRVARGVSDQFRRETAERAVAQTLRRSVDDADTAVSVLDAEARGLAGPGRPSTAQALMDDAPGVLSLEASTARDLPGLNARLAQQRSASAQEIAAEASRSFPGQPGVVQESFGRLRDASRAAYKAAYDAIDDAAVGPVPLARVKAAAQASVEGAGRYGQRGVPALARKVLNDADDVSFAELQKLRAAINDRLKTVSPAVKSGAGTASAAEEANLLRMKGAVDETFRGLEDAGGAAAAQLSRANRQYAQYQETYGRAHKTIRNLMDREDPGDVVKRLVGSGTARPSDEARRLVRALSDDPDALEGMRRIWVQEAFGVDDLSNASGARAVKFLEQHERPSRILLGDDGYETARALADRVRKSTYGRTGTPGFSQGTGSANAPLSDHLESGAEALAAVVNPTGAAWNAVTRWMKDNATAEVQKQLLADALVDPKIARDMLRKVTPSNFREWTQRMDQHLRTSAARAGIVQGAKE